MLDIIRDGIKSSENLVTLPFKAIREVTGDANKTLTELAGLSEEIISIPFKMASQAIDNFAIEENLQETTGERTGD